MKLNKTIKVLGKTIPVWVIATIALAGVASATLLTYYGTITATANIQQSVLLDGKDITSAQATDTLSGALGGETFCYVHSLKNQASVPATVSLANTCSGSLYPYDCGGVSTNYLNGNQVTYWTANYGSPNPPLFNRSKTPFDFGTTDTISEGLNPDGSAYLQLNDASGTYYDIGFYKVYGTLGSLTNVPFVSSGPVAINLWLDTDKNGEFFVWSGNTFTSVGNDAYALGSGTVSPLTNSSQFFMTTGSPASCAGQTVNISQLKSGVCTGIDSSTPVAIWVGIDQSGAGTKSATVTSFNGAPLNFSSITLQPSQTVPFSSCYSFATAIAPSTYTVTTSVNPA